MKVAGIIPARYNSSRLPGKPLKMIGNTSLIMRVFKQSVSAACFDKIVVATDDLRIYDHVQEFGGKAVMTSDSHSSGTERCAEAIGKMDGDFDFVINIQGDEPFINPAHLKSMVSALNSDTEILTLCMPIADENELSDTSIPKVVTDFQGRAMYFSRATIPFLRDNSKVSPLSRFNFLKHIGVYAYRTDILATIVKFPSSSVEMAEQLEQLRWLYNGLKILTLTIPNEKTISVDTEEDLKNARKMLV